MDNPHDPDVADPAGPDAHANARPTRRRVLRGALALVAGLAGAGPRPLVASDMAAGRVLARPAAGPESGPSGRGRPPGIVKAAYLSYFGVGHHAIRGHVLGMLDRTELNAVVIDVKGDRGFIPYDSQVPLARQAGAMGPGRIGDFDGLLAGLRDKGVYTIARIVVFKDNVLARHRPEWAVIDARSRSLWLDNERLAWLDPFRTEAWAYSIAVAREAALKGFDEIQLDYLRFPSEGQLSAARYSRPPTEDGRLAAVTGFLRQARDVIAPTGAALALDVFGYTAFNPGDTSIGQRIEDLAPLLDYLCPMAYPSAYHLGIPGYPNPVKHPYEIVFETVKRTRERAAHSAVRVRPWIQDFRDYAFDRRPFGIPEVTAQMRAAVAAGASGWMLWNPRNQYTDGALAPRPVSLRSSEGGCEARRGAAPPFRTSPPTTGWRRRSRRSST
jgi:hypothetical protein